LRSHPEVGVTFVTSWGTRVGVGSQIRLQPLFLPAASLQSTRGKADSDLVGEQSALKVQTSSAISVDIDEMDHLVRHHIDRYAFTPPDRELECFDLALG
jgi:hypothetical protein